MRVILTAALAGLALSPVTAQTADKQVGFSEAIACSSLYTILATAVEGEPEYEEFVDIASRWLVIATDRDGRENVVAEDELQEWVSSLLSELDLQASDDAREEFLFEGIDVCEANYQLIAEEFDSIDLD